MDCAERQLKNAQAVGIVLAYAENMALRFDEVSPVVIRTVAITPYTLRGTWRPQANLEDTVATRASRLTIAS